MLKVYFFLLVILLYCNCSSSPEENTSGEDSSTDTSYYVPEGGYKSAANKPAVDTIVIDEMKFTPQEIKVHKGDTIVWINHDLVAHCVTEEITKAWTSSPIPSGASWKMVVQNGGEYYCAIHLVMKGRIVLEESSDLALSSQKFSN